MAGGDFAPGFMIRLQQKICGWRAMFLTNCNWRRRARSLTAALFTRALEMGLGEDGNQGLYKLWQ